MDQVGADPSEADEPYRQNQTPCHHPRDALARNLSWSVRGQNPGERLDGTGVLSGREVCGQLLDADRGSQLLCQLGGRWIIIEQSAPQHGVPFFSQRGDRFVLTRLFHRGARSAKQFVSEQAERAHITATRPVRGSVPGQRLLASQGVHLGGEQKIDRINFGLHMFPGGERAPQKVGLNPG